MIKAHIQYVHNKSVFKCDKCDYISQTKGNLKSYKITIHEKVKNYSCQVCNFTSFAKGNFVTHMRIHTGEKPYNCKICGERFTQQTDLNIHKRSHKPNDAVFLNGGKLTNTTVG